MLSGSVVAALFFLSSSPATAKESTAMGGKDGACLLNMRSSLGKSSMLATQSEAVSLWRQQHTLRMQELNESKGVLDEFISAQANAGTACSARLMEAKRALDQMQENAKSLADQVHSHEQVLETESENLNITMMSIKAVEEAYATENKECDRLKAEAIKDMKQYEAELEELRQIANPKARYTHKVSVDLLTPSSEAKHSLLELGEFTRETCVAFVHYMMRHRRNSFNDDPTKACDEQRKELQEAFTKAYKDLSDLKKDAKDRSEDKSCYEAAEAKKTAASVPLAAAREQATQRIESANDAIASLEPVVALVKGRMEKLAEHIDEKLTPECMEAGDASKILTNIRELILMVEQCPGGSKFKLVIPTEPPATAAPTEAPEPEPVVEVAPIQRRL